VSGSDLVLMRTVNNVLINPRGPAARSVLITMIEASGY
jgi:hypothetical protein